MSALEKTQFFSCCIPNPYVDFVINALDSLKAFKDLFLAVEKWNRCFPCYYPDKQFLKIKKFKTKPSQSYPDATRSPLPKKVYWQCG